MTQREQHTSSPQFHAYGTAPDGGVRDGRDALMEPTHSSEISPAGGVSLSNASQVLQSQGGLWEDWYRRASPAQRQTLLQLARTQGVLTTECLESPASQPSRESSALQMPDQPESSPTPHVRADALIDKLLKGGKCDLPTVQPAPLVFQDTDLDEAQRAAVARAIHSPDVFLIRGLPGTGKSRIVSEIILQATARGERVLLLGPHAPTIDRVLVRLAWNERICPLRCLESEEEFAQLSSCVKRLTLPERLRTIEEESLPEVREEATRGRQTLELRRRDAQVWERLEEIVGRQIQINEDRVALEARRERIPDEMESLFPPGLPCPEKTPSAYRKACTRREEACAQLEQQQTELHQTIEQARTELTQIEEEQKDLQPRLLAWKQLHIWKADWWRYLIKGGAIRRRSEECQALAQQLHQRVGEAEQKIADLEKEKHRVEDEFHADRQQRLKEEVAKNLARVEEQGKELQDEQEQILEQWQNTRCELTPGTEPPLEPTLEAVHKGRQTWEKQLEEEEQAYLRAREWTDVLEQLLPTLSETLIENANVVAATPTSLRNDPHFGPDANGTQRLSLRSQAAVDGGDSLLEVQFDRLILEEAHLLTEVDLRESLAWIFRRAQRWVFVGEPVLEPPGQSPPQSKGASRGSSRRGRSSATVVPATRTPEPLPFSRLWDRLHPAPRSHLRHTWVHESGRLICRFCQVTPEQERWVEVERVADRPEIELRILACPKQEPRLAEISFPITVSVKEAKEYVCNELDELAVQSRGDTLCWRETPTEWILELTDQESPPCCESNGPSGSARPGTSTSSLDEARNERSGSYARNGGKARAPSSSQAESGNTVTIELEPGVHERLGPCSLNPEEERQGAIPWHTCSLHFSLEQNWTLGRAQEWVESKLGLHDPGRTAELTVVHRSAPLLTQFLADLMFEDSECPPVNLPSAPLDSQQRPSPHCERSESLSEHDVLIEESIRGVPPVRFIAIPPLTVGEDTGKPAFKLKRERGRKEPRPSPETGQVLSPRAVAGLLRGSKGAGLEMDLADPRCREHIPAEIRDGLPRKGLVNYAEARAIVQTLEYLVTNPAFREVAQRWQEGNPGSSGQWSLLRRQPSPDKSEGILESQRASPPVRKILPEEKGHKNPPSQISGNADSVSTQGALACPIGPVLGVMALYPSQVELIQQLVRRCRTLKQSLRIEVGTPADFQQRDVFVALVSLTRSHTHRAVPYGGPAILAQAFTRGVSRLYLFGDPGTLLRRSQWHGALDPLDTALAQKERAIVTQLVKYMQGDGAYPKAFCFQQGAPESKVAE